MITIPRPGLAAVAILLAATGVYAQGNPQTVRSAGTASIKVPLPIHIQDMGSMRTIKVRVETSGGTPLFDMVTAAADSGSPPGGAWEFLDYVTTGVYERYITMPEDGSFHVLARIEWEDTENPGFPSDPSDIDYLSKGAFDPPEEFFASQGAKSDHEKLAAAKALTKDILKKLKASKIDASVTKHASENGKRRLKVKFDHGFGNEYEEVRVGFTKLEEITNPNSQLPQSGSESDSWVTLPTNTTHRYFAHGWIKYGPEDYEQIFVRRGPINIKIEAE